MTDDNNDQMNKLQRPLNKGKRRSHSVEFSGIFSRFLHNGFPSQDIPKKTGKLLKQSEVKMPSRRTTINCKQNRSEGLTEKCASDESKIDINSEYLEYLSLDQAIFLVFPTYYWPRLSNLPQL